MGLEHERSVWGHLVCAGSLISLWMRFSTSGRVKVLWGRNVCMNEYKVMTVWFTVHQTLSKEQWTHRCLRLRTVKCWASSQGASKTLKEADHPNMEIWSSFTHLPEIVWFSFFSGTQLEKFWRMYFFCKITENTEALCFHKLCTIL